MALGATPGRIRADVLRRAGVIAGIGAATGLVIALVTSRLLTALLFQVSPTDPVALGAACLALLGVAAAAAYFPARRATSIDPMQALRAD
jgi:ABC-type antimicrobial peptide transport system permease subunit